MTKLPPSKVLKLTIGDTTKPLSGWAEHSPVCAEAIRQRLQRGMSPQEAVFSPPIGNNISGR